MGICSGKPCKRNETDVPLDNRELDDVIEHDGEVYMLISGIDYACDNQSWAGPPPAGHGPLDTKFAWNMMVELAKQCNVPEENIKLMWNEQCTKDGICDGIAEVASKCAEGDTFIFYYTGHGDCLPQDDAEEAEAMDNCLCTVGPNGCTDNVQMRGPGSREEVWLRDDDLAAAIVNNIEDGVKVVVIADCCHSGSLCDFGPGSVWDEHEVQAISMSGCADTETSAGTGHGGMFSRALSKSIEDMLHDGSSFTVAHIYNHVLENYLENKSTGHTQHITVSNSHCEVDEMQWPLIPAEGYVSPFLDEK